MKKIISSFKNLTVSQLYDILKLRQDVFIIEQNCIYNDFDGYDSKATHLCFYDDNFLSAYSRIFAPGIKYNKEASIGRIIVSSDYRGGTLGKKLISESIDVCLKKYPNTEIKIEAQAALKNYYSKFGFKAVTEIYKVDGIDHLEMIL